MVNAVTAMISPNNKSGLPCLPKCPNTIKIGILVT